MARPLVAAADFMVGCKSKMSSQWCSGLSIKKYAGEIESIAPLSAFFFYLILCKSGWRLLTGYQIPFHYIIIPAYSETKWDDELVVASFSSSSSSSTISTLRFLSPLFFSRFYFDTLWSAAVGLRSIGVYLFFIWVDLFTHFLCVFEATTKNGDMARCDMPNANRNNRSFWFLKGNFDYNAKYNEWEKKTENWFQHERCGRNASALDIDNNHNGTPSKKKIEMKWQKKKTKKNQICIRNGVREMCLLYASATTVHSNV